MNKISLIGVISAIFAAAVFSSTFPRPAAACNRINGCTMDVLLEGHDMMHDGRMNENMREGQENIQAFRRQQAADQAAGRTAPPSR
jgi:hypothetical protein